LRSLLPSLAILVGVFFFISSACFSDGDDGSSYGYDQCPTASDTAAPPSAFARIVQPQIDQVFGAPAVDGLVNVPVSLRAGVVEIAPRGTCQSGSGHFVLSIERIAGEGCVDPATLAPLELVGGETATALLLSPGTYALKVRVFNSGGFAYEPEISATVHFIVDGAAPGFDGGVCN
jgi:hypothetical protein